MNRTYENALRLLQTRRRSRPKTIVSKAPLDPASGSGTQPLKGLPSIVGMKEWLQDLGHSENDVNNLNVVHIAGTKGKGSTCAFTRSFLQTHGLRTGFPKRVGQYCSPDLRFIRERIQIDGKPISEDQFTRYFFEVWERLMPAESGVGEPVRQPAYLQFILLLALHTFIREKVEATILETHNGGEFDSTNVVAKPVATGITALGMDHILQLGPTIENIAWHKAGIMKPGVPAVSMLQDAGPAEVLRKRAAEKGTSLEFVPVDETLPDNKKVLSVPVQRLNCSIALALSKNFLRATAPGQELTAEDIARGVENFSWAGRFQVIEERNSQWFLDGAHNTLSIVQAAQWFAVNSSPEKCRILIYAHISDQHQTLKSSEKRFSDVIAGYVSIWKKVDRQATVSTEPTIEKALNLARRLGGEKGMQTLVTGSLRLVGGALNLLEA
ncbi:hypothetical protein MW887_004836 [Aspergillus wentii]|nr:hypothetical protein MW887_004836 [Aspergillus wentii]